MKITTMKLGLSKRVQSPTSEYNSMKPYAEIEISVDEGEDMEAARQWLKDQVLLGLAEMEHSCLKQMVDDGKLLEAKRLSIQATEKGFNTAPTSMSHVADAGPYITSPLNGVGYTLASALDNVPFLDVAQGVWLLKTNGQFNGSWLAPNPTGPSIGVTGEQVGYAGMLPPGYHIAAAPQNMATGGTYPAVQPQSPPPSPTAPATLQPSAPHNGSAASPVDGQVSLYEIPFHPYPVSGR